MASRMLHLAVLEELMKHIPIKNKNRFRLGCILPDAYNQAVPNPDSHLKIFVCGKSKKTYDLDQYLSMFNDKMDDELYIGYYLHLIQDLVFRELLYDKYKWNPTIPGNVERLHNELFFFTEAMADEFVSIAAKDCRKELQSLKAGRHYVDAYERAWLNKPFSLLQTTQNTRDLGGYCRKGQNRCSVSYLAASRRRK